MTAAPLHVVLDELVHPQNVSAILRTCETAGVTGVHVAGADPFVGSPLRISRGAERWLSIHHHDNVAACIALLQQQGIRILCASNRPGAQDYRSVDLTGPIALVLGNESHGVSSSAAVLADAVIYIPMLGRTLSLNVSVAAGVLLFEALRQRGVYTPPGEPPAR